MNTSNPYTPPGAEVADREPTGSALKLQIRRLSPHQNAKVAAIMFAVTSLIFIVPFMLIGLAAAPSGEAGFSTVVLLLAPLFYLVVGYVMTVIGCWLYNVLFKYVGGFEYESSAQRI